MNRLKLSSSIAFCLGVLLTAAGCSNNNSSQPASLTDITGTKDNNSAMTSTVSAVSDTATLVSRTSDTTPASAEKTNVSWIDSDVFDKTLSKTMARQPAEIDVNLNTGANQVPARINSWFNEISDRGGHVSTVTETAWAQMNGEQTADAVQTRGIFLMVLPFLFQIISQAVHEEATYGPASNYDALLVTDNSRSRIDMLVFKHKEPATKARADK